MNTLTIKLSAKECKTIDLRVHAAYCKYILFFYEKHRSYPWAEEDAKIIRLHDHEGLLLVNWSSRPTEEQKKRIESAWGYCGEDVVSHYITNIESLDEDTYEECVRFFNEE
jgi:hypothetical protein